MFQAGSGLTEHWTCKHCGAWNHYGNERCHTCKAPKDGSITPLRTPFMDAVASRSEIAQAFSDSVNQPSHYSRWKMQPIEFIAINDLPFWVANVIKYTMRYDAKNGLEDLYKARSYLDMKIRQMEGVERFWEKPVAEERKLNKK